MVLSAATSQAGVAQEARRVAEEEISASTSPPTDAGYVRSRICATPMSGDPRNTGRARLSPPPRRGHTTYSPPPLPPVCPARLPARRPSRRPSGTERGDRPDLPPLEGTAQRVAVGSGNQ